MQATEAWRVTLKAGTYSSVLTRKSPWKRRSSRRVYENPWIRVREDAVVRPDGADGIYGVVETPLAIGVVAMTSRDEIYLVGQWRYATDQWSWEIIEGGGAKDESDLQTAQRELREEAGLVADHWRPLGGEIHLSNSFTDERARVYLATSLTEVPAEPEGTEQLELRLETLQTCLNMVDEGTIKDAISVVSLLRLARLRS